MTAQTITGTVVEQPGTELGRRAGDLDIERLVAPRRGRIKVFSETEARRITDEINHTQVRLWLLVEQANERRAWAALGYESWKDYVTRELQMSESRSYQLLDQAAVIRAIAQAGSIHPLAIEPPPARVVQRVKDDLAGVKRVTRDAVRTTEADPDSPETADAIITALRELAAEYAPTRSTGGPPAEEPEDTEESPPDTQKPPRGMRWCPCCDGSGIVTLARSRELAAKLAE